GGEIALATSLPGPTGESNRLTLTPRPPILCLGPGPEASEAQLRAVKALGGVAKRANGLTPDELKQTDDIGAVLWWGDPDMARHLVQALAGRDGPIVPLIGGMPDVAHVMSERHICVDTTAAGGNAALLGGRA
ncbi:MAG: bifunctional proline dehydrogenase/L-glutamate gamma-semialdehyde dehydrogenase, partial [Pseudomonadota bacterium]